MNLDVNHWNLSAVLVTALAAGCGPTIQLDDAGETEGVNDDDGVDTGVDTGVATDVDVTVPPQCSDNADCDIGSVCDGGECVQEYDDYDHDDYYDDCGIECCDGDCGYYEDDCEVDSDSESNQECVDRGYATSYCEPLPQLPECGGDQAPQLAPIPINGAGDGDVVALAFVDANMDGLADLVVARQDRTDLHLGPLTESAVALPVPAGSAVQDAVSADINGDGTPDIVVALGSDGMAVLLGDGTGGFALGYESGKDNGTVDQVLAVDFDGDGNMDVITSGSQLQVRFGDGTGPLGLGATMWDDAIDHVALTSAEGSPPTVLAAESSSVREWQIGVGTDTREYGTPLSHFAVEQWLPLSAGSGAEHGLLAAGSTQGSLVLDFSGGGNTARFWAPSLSFQDGATGDLMGDGNHDFLLLGADGLGLTYIGHIPGALSCQLAYDVGDITALASGDIDGDGRAEIVTSFGPDLTLFVAQ
ncbi:MAG: VCBS repeat-containing protein [Nannocystaceae bacterium]|nr:VCBS repeat-containing protein [Nannocystaceae bacterium]